MSFEHGEPPEGMECLVTMEDIDKSSYCEYQTMPSGKWYPSKFCSSVIRRMLDEQFQRYLDDVEKATRDCAAAVRRLVNKGPPVYINDAHGLPLEEGETHVSKLWFCDDGTEVSAVLKNALQGEERQNLWDSQKEVI
mmetsp:Transcript_42657/g.114187  ORF Transcript_42657/g.114187 Transcript_42657/m.114187 type:complete len:137 (+) Transcript_42657:37-447(+)